MNIEDIRKSIDETDREICALFVHRMELCGLIGDLKKLEGLDICSPSREEEIFEKAEINCGEKFGKYGIELYKIITDLSKEYQLSKRKED